ncbi:MAG: hypothetical protein A4E51_00811 [Methanosaeta sp. PtaU1.Bin055]|nr:MAG: hypothetical protein A4E51_00811 [Methanosaeta sp. PtaU1.Bin055]
MDDRSPSHWQQAVSPCRSAEASRGIGPGGAPKEPPPRLSGAFRAPIRASAGRRRRLRRSPRPALPPPASGSRPRRRRGRWSPRPRGRWRTFSDTSRCAPSDEPRSAPPRGPTPPPRRPGWGPSSGLSSGSSSRSEGRWDPLWDRQPVKAECTPTPRRLRIGEPLRRRHRAPQSRSVRGRGAPSGSPMRSPPLPRPSDWRRSRPGRDRGLFRRR